MKSTSHTIVYSAETKFSIVHGLRSMLRDFRNGFGLAKRLFIRDTRSQYRQSLLGFSWAVFVPLASTMVWVLLNKSGILKVDDLAVPYPIFVLSGILLWQSFLESLNAPLQMFHKSKSILTKINIPKESLILAGWFKVLLNLGIKLVIFLLLSVYYGGILGSEILLFLPMLFMLTLFGLTFGIILTPIGSLYGDVQRIIQSGSQLFFFLTPIIYPAREVGVFQVIDRFNPVAVFIDSCRYALTGVGNIDWGVYLSYCAVLILLFFLAMAVYRISMPIIIERVGS